MSAADEHSRPWETIRRGLLLLISSPAGAGKTSLSRRLVADHSDLTLSISATTRAPRPGEEEGREYFFKTRPEFEAMIERGEFLEWAVVNGNYYGTPKRPVIEALEGGHDVLFDIDWQGTKQLRATAPDDLVSVFILPPSIRELERRLYARAQDSAEIVARRMAKAISEISHWDEYDYVIVNQNIETALEKIVSILQAERLRRTRQEGLIGFIEKLNHEASQ